MLTVGRIAAQAGLSPKAVRLYEAHGLIDPPERTPAGYRTYVQHPMGSAWLLSLVAAGQPGNRDWRVRVDHDDSSGIPKNHHDPHINAEAENHKPSDQTPCRGIERHSELAGYVPNACPDGSLTPLTVRLLLKPRIVDRFSGSHFPQAARCG